MTTSVGMVRAAVERQFEIIGEAMRQLATLDQGMAEGITHYRRVIAFRNILAHGYAGVDDQRGGQLAGLDKSCGQNSRPVALADGCLSAVPDLTAEESASSCPEPLSTLVCEAQANCVRDGPGPLAPTRSQHVEAGPSAVRPGGWTARAQQGMSPGAGPYRPPGSAMVKIE